MKKPKKLKALPAKKLMETLFPKPVLKVVERNLNQDGKRASRSD